MFHVKKKSAEYVWSLEQVGLYLSQKWGQSVLKYLFVVD